MLAQRGVRLTAIVVAEYTDQEPISHAFPSRLS